ncbi:HlyD family type I secretion periplasmic adaptor subunit [Shinella sp. G-2]|uniref:HlyD family type I secretion periplasmic adaptor subunit n=1 Tax=Shinella sp. G-2 TaxID=3133141 RepID=UPI003D07C205
MSQAVALRDEYASVVEQPSPVADSARGTIFAGFFIVLIFFAGFGGWAVTAPLNGAVVGEAIVKVEGNRKSVQHQDGGVIKELRVKDGDHVKEGDVLIVLDDTQSLAEVDILSQQYAMLRAIEARLAAESASADVVAFPVELTESTEPYARASIETQQHEFESRRSALSGEAQILDYRISQLKEQIVGNEAQAKAYSEQLASVNEEAKSLSGLVKSGAVTRTRISQLERTVSGLEGQIAASQAAKAAALQSVAEYTQQIAQIQKNRSAEIAKELSETQSKLLDVLPRLHNAKVSLGRTEIRSPYAGQVVGLNVFSIGGVIGRGEKILDVVPDQTALIVEARVRVEDISDLHPGMPAEVHFTSYKQRTTPAIHGSVTQISADRLTEERTGQSYYAVSVAMAKGDMEANPEIKLYPGMPARVMITTRQRTALDYLLGPLTQSFDQAFREK